MGQNTDRRTSTTGRGSRALDIALWVLQVLMALAFVFSAYSKITKQPQAVGVFEAMGGPGDWLLYVVAVLEIVGAVGLLIPRLCGLAALGLVALMVGAVISHALFGGPSLFALIYLVPVAVIAWGRRASTAAMLRQS